MSFTVLEWGDLIKENNKHLLDSQNGVFKVAMMLEHYAALPALTGLTGILDSAD